MTANIDPVHLPPSGSGTPAEASPARGARSSSAFGAALAAAQRSPVAETEALPPVPPAELSAHIAAAARAWDALAAGGQNVVFNEREDGQLSIELQDDEGNELQTMSGSQLFGLIDEHGGQ